MASRTTSWQPAILFFANPVSHPHASLSPSRVLALWCTRRPPRLLPLRRCTRRTSPRSPSSLSLCASTSTTAQRRCVLGCLGWRFPTLLCCCIESAHPSDSPLPVLLLSLPRFAASGAVVSSEARPRPRSPSTSAHAHVRRLPVWVKSNSAVLGMCRLSLAWWQFVFKRSVVVSCQPGDYTSLPDWSAGRRLGLVGFGTGGRQDPKNGRVKRAKI